MWWQTLNLAQKVFFCIATPASVFLIVQIILMLIGFGADVGGAGDVDVDVDADLDVDVDVDTDLSSGGGEVLDGDAGFSLFTLRGLIAFFAVGGWVGYTFADGDLILSVCLAIVSGTIALVLMGLILKWLMSLQSNGNLRYNDAIGTIGEVYLTIPPKDQGKGKVTVLLNERLVEHSAIQNGQEPLKTGKKVKIVAVVADNFVVEKV